MAAALYNHKLKAPSHKQQGLTLLEILIALSIFAIIGVASYRVLATVINSQKISTQHSQQLSQFQKAVTLIDADLQQLVSRDIRVSGDTVANLLVDSGAEYPLELTRAGWSNPLMLSRSSLQRVAYDIGEHPQSNNKDSRFYQDKRQYLRRHYWKVLDRPQDAQVITQAILPDIEAFSVEVIDKKGRQKQWPPTHQKARNKDEEEEEKEDKPLSIVLSMTHLEMGEFSRIYKVY